MNARYASPVPVAAHADLDRFQIHSRAEVLALLREMRGEAAQVAVYYDAAGSFALTRLLAVTPEFEELVFDAGRNPAVNQRICTSPRLTFVSLVRQVKLQFQAYGAEMVELDDLPAFRVRVPETLLRLQRRSHYRITTPLVRPAVCTLPPSEGKTEPTQGVLLDLSCGGCSLQLAAGSVTAQVGEVIPGCGMALPGMEPLRLALEVRAAESLNTHRPKPVLRLRCRFRALPEAGVTTIQRYINKLESVRLNRP